MYGPTPKISWISSRPGPLPAAGVHTVIVIEPSSGIATCSSRCVTGADAGRCTKGSQPLGRSSGDGPVAELVTQWVLSALSVTSRAPGGLRLRPAAGAHRPDSHRAA